MWLLNTKEQQQWTKGKVLFVALIVRLTLVLYSNIHDYVFNVNFTDIDYHVFSDAAHHVAQGNSPFERATYRYTPVLAWLLVPNEKWHDFGKFLFCFFDVVVGWLCFKLMTDESKIVRKSPDQKVEKKEELDSAILPVVSFWLANPLTAVISARGNADCLVCAAVLFTLYLLKRDKVFLAALAHGSLAVHLKIYPLIYLPSIFISLAAISDDSGFFVKIKALVFNFKGYAFVLISIFSFCCVVLGLYCIYGDVFLEEFLLYHVKRRDIRHNFSIYFLPLYLVQGDEFLSKLIGFVAFIPQLFCVVYFALRFSKDLPFCWFLSTFMFVSFNKVCTSQYFVWYIVFLPLISERLKMARDEACKLIALWFVGQGFWLFFAYLFEFQGKAVFEYIWLSSLLFLFINCYICRRLISCYSPSVTKLKVN